MEFRDRAVGDAPPSTGLDTPSADEAAPASVSDTVSDPDPVITPVLGPVPPLSSRGGRLRRLLFGPPRDVKDPRTYHAVSLAALFAWVGLGADGLSSSAYGPDEAYRALGEHTSLAALLAFAT